jgi:hypothetical protein
MVRKRPVYEWGHIYMQPDKIGLSSAIKVFAKSQGIDNIVCFLPMA